MQDTDTGTIELTRGEARKVINALSSETVTASGADERRALNVKEFLQREFGFEDRHFDDDDGLNDGFMDIFGDDDDDEIQLSRAEAAEVESALEKHETGSTADEAEELADLRARFVEEFDLDSAA